MRIPAIIPGAEHEQELQRPNGHIGERPLALGIGLVSESPSIQMHRERGEVKQLDPIGVLSIVVGNSLAIVRKEFRNDDGGKCLKVSVHLNVFVLSFLACIFLFGLYFFFIIHKNLCFYVVE